MRGRDIKRYGYDWANLWLIATFPSRHYDIDKYPSIKQYLLSFGIERLEQTGKTHKVNDESIKARKKTSNKWFETQDSISYLEDFFKPKIVYSEIVREPQFYLDTNGQFFPEATVFIMNGDCIEYLYHAFHTNIVTYIFKRFYAGGGLGDEGYRYKKVFFEKLPIPKPDEQLSFDINNSNVENVIQKMYGLTDDEIIFIDSQS